MSIIFFLLGPAILFLINFAILTILLKYVFKVQNFKWITVAGILIIGGLIGAFFDKPWWLGTIVYLIIVGIALYKKFSLKLSQVIIALAINFAASFLAFIFLS